MVKFTKSKEHSFAALNFEINSSKNSPQMKQPIQTIEITLIHVILNQHVFNLKKIN